jgi:hypothetical protein
MGNYNLIDRAEKIYFEDKEYSHFSLLALFILYSAAMHNNTEYISTLQIFLG